MTDAVDDLDLPTEARNPRTLELDQLATLDVLAAINREDAVVAHAVAACLPVLAEVVDAAATRLRAGGRVHYFGAGTSGRLAVLDAAELEPTFSLEPGRVVAHQAGGAEALTTAIEGAEDRVEEGVEAAAEVRDTDLAIGLAASGRTPYVRGALETAAATGAATALVSANPQAPIAAVVDWHVCVDTGPEAVAGSTRLKAGTAQKMALNAFSTAVMVRLGKTYSNLMVDLHAGNDKLRARTLTILREASGADDDACQQALRHADGHLKTALVMLRSGLPPERARAALDRNDGNAREALRELAATTATAPRPTDAATGRARRERADLAAEVVLRRATVDDAEGVAAVMCRALKGAYLDDGRAASPDRRRLAALTPDDLVAGARAALAGHDEVDWTVVAEAAGEVIGFERLRVRPAGGGATWGEVASLYVDPATWSAGRGGQLLDEALTQLRDRGCHGVWLWVWEENERATRFYRRHGFAPDGTEDDHRLDVWGTDLGFDLHVLRFARDLQPHEEGPAQDQGEP